MWGGGGEEGGREGLTIGKGIKCFLAQQIIKAINPLTVRGLHLKGWQSRADVRHGEGGISDLASCYYKRSCHAAAVGGILTKPDTYMYQIRTEREKT